jgi:hypothetical protein
MLLLGAASFAQASPVQAATAYGAGANPTGDTIGGGTGYSDIIDSSAAKYTVSTKSQLLSALAGATSGQIIYVADSVQIDMTGSKNLTVPAGVILASGRGHDGSSGGLIYTNDLTSTGYPDFFLLRAGARVTGLRLRGPDGAIGTSPYGYLYGGLAVTDVSDVEIDNCEVYNWPYAGVVLNGSPTAWVHHNYIHHCRRTGFGYGVAVSGCSALIEANLFDYNRHSIMGTRGYPLSSYEARYNVFEVHNVTGQSCDMHGGNDISDATVPAGGTIKIHHNTFKAIWNAVNIRGIPTDQALVYNNWALHEDWDPTRVFMQSLDNLAGHTPYERMKVYDNWYGTSAPPSSDSEPTPSNQPPATPSAPSGTQQGKTGTSYTYWAKTTDPDGDSISYTFDWGDGSTVASILKSSGATISATYSWANAGTYLIKVRGTDSNGNASAWSPTLTVGIVTAPEPAAIPNSPPTVPAAPSGTANGKVSSEYQYSAVTTDPEGDTLQYTFDWGDGSNSTTTQINSGVTATANHAWGQPGTYAIQVKATDSKGAVSALSPALSVSIVSQPVATSNSSPAAPAAPSSSAIGPACRHCCRR